MYVEDARHKVFIDVMFGNIDIDAARIDFWTRKYQDEMFEKSIIIGDSLMHGFFVLICEGEDKGVYYWDDTWIILNVPMTKITSIGWRIVLPIL